MIKIGQIGLGHNHGAKKMECVRKFPQFFEVVGYAPENDEWKQKRGDLPEYQGLPCLSIDELLDKCDAIMVETEVPMLTEMAQRAIDAGKHVHIDKPASGTLEDFEKLIESAKKKNLTVQLAYMYRYNPAVQKCLKWKEEGRFGDITMVKAEMSTCHAKCYREWMSTFRGGMMYILGSHMLDLVMVFLGVPEKITTFFSHSGLDGVEFPDNTLAVLEYPRAIGRVFASAVEHNGWGNRQLVVSGTKAKAHIMPLEKTTRLFLSDSEISASTFLDMKKEIPVPDTAWFGRYDSMMIDFHDCVIGKKQNPFTYGHELAVQKALIEICSADKRSEVEG